MGCSSEASMKFSRNSTTEKSAVLRDVFGNRHQFATAHAGVEAAELDRVLFSDLEAPAGHRCLPGAQQGCLLRSPGLTPDGVLGVVLYFAGYLQQFPVKNLRQM